MLLEFLRMSQGIDIQPKIVLDFRLHTEGIWKKEKNQPIFPIVRIYSWNLWTYFPLGLNFRTPNTSSVRTFPWMFPYMCNLKVQLVWALLVFTVMYCSPNSFSIIIADDMLSICSSISRTLSITLNIPCKVTRKFKTVCTKKKILVLKLEGIIDFTGKKFIWTFYTKN